jgi:hypothetical protein
MPVLSEVRGRACAGAVVLASSFLLFGGTVQAQRAASKSAVPTEILTGASAEGTFPAGWVVRADTTIARNPKDTTALVTRTPGWGVKSGPSSILWSPRNRASGSYVLAAHYFLLPPVTATLPAYGVFLGGRNMGTPSARYTEFLIRNDMKYTVRQHVGAKTVVLKDWTTLAGLVTHSGKRTELAGNRFRIIVDPQMVQFVVNRAVAFSLPRATVAPDGVFGMRIGTDQELAVESLELEKPAGALAPSPPKPRRPSGPQPLGTHPVKPIIQGVPTGQRLG